MPDMEKDRQQPMMERKSNRLEFHAEVQFRKGRTRARVELVDISTHGARLSAVHVLRNGDRFWLKLPRIEPQEAMVGWSDEFIVGCRFVRPLHPSVLEDLVHSAEIPESPPSRWAIKGNRC